MGITRSLIGLSSYQISISIVSSLWSSNLPKQPFSQVMAKAAQVSQFPQQLIHTPYQVIPWVIHLDLWDCSLGVVVYKGAAEPVKGRKIRDWAGIQNKTMFKERETFRPSHQLFGAAVFRTVLSVLDRWLSWIGARITLVPTANSPTFVSSVPPVSLSKEQNFRRGDRCMKGCKSLKLNKNLASTLPSIQSLGTLSLFLLVSCLPSEIVSPQETTIPRTFADWCLNEANLSANTKKTINALLQVAETTDCSQADKLLSTPAKLSLDLRDNYITDLKPLSALTNLIELSLINNLIADLRPLSTLTNLTELWLTNNQTITDKNCPVKPESICKFVPLQLRSNWNSGLII